MCERIADVVGDFPTESFQAIIHDFPSHRVFQSLKFASVGSAFPLCGRTGAFFVGDVSGAPQDVNRTTAKERNACGIIFVSVLKTGFMTFQPRKRLCSKIIVDSSAMQNCVIPKNEQIENGKGV